MGTKREPRGQKAKIEGLCRNEKLEETKAYSLVKFVIRGAG